MLFYTWKEEEFSGLFPQTKGLDVVPVCPNCKIYLARRDLDCPYCKQRPTEGTRLRPDSETQISERQAVAKVHLICTSDRLAQLVRRWFQEDVVQRSVTPHVPPQILDLFLLNLRREPWLTNLIDVILEHAGRNAQQPTLELSTYFFNPGRNAIVSDHLKDCTTLVLMVDNEDLEYFQNSLSLLRFVIPHPTQFAFVPVVLSRSGEDLSTFTALVEGIQASLERRVQFYHRTDTLVFSYGDLADETVSRGRLWQQILGAVDATQELGIGIQDSLAVLPSLQQRVRVLLDNFFEGHPQSFVESDLVVVAEVEKKCAACRVEIPTGTDSSSSCATCGRTYCGECAKDALEYNFCFGSLLGKNHPFNPEDSPLRKT